MLRDPRLAISHKSNRSLSSSQSVLLFTTILPAPPLPPFSSFSAMAPNNSFNCSSVTLLLSCPDLASMISRFSTSVARDSLTRRMRPRRSAASGESIWDKIEVRASASCCLRSSISYLSLTQWVCKLQQTFVDRLANPHQLRQTPHLVAVGVAQGALFLSGNWVSAVGKLESRIKILLFYLLKICI